MTPIALGSSYWWLGIAILFTIGFALFFFAPKQGHRHFERWQPILGWIIFINQILYWLMAIMDDRFFLHTSLPLHLCGLSQLLLFAHLVLKQHWAFPVVAFWGPLGGMMGMLTPALTEFNVVYVVQYFVGHSVIIVVPLYLLRHGGRRIPPNYFWRVIIFTNILGFSMMLVNYLLSSNYMYVSQPPPVSPYNSGHWLLEWPYYLIFIELQVIFFVWLYWMAIHKYRQHPDVDS